MPAQKQVIRINSLSGGVARQAPSKRTPTEVAQADNVMLSLERSAEKRQALQHIQCEGLQGTLNIAEDSDDLMYYYYDLDGTNRQVIVVNPSAVSSANIVQIFSADTGAKEAAPSLIASLAANPGFQTYLQAGSGTAKEKLRFIEVRGDLMILNTQVEAKFLNSGSGAAVTYTDPVTGIKVRDTNQEVDPNGVLQDVGLNRKNYSQFRLPPDPTDVVKGNGAESQVGTGLIWFARESYQDFPGQAFYQSNSATQQPWYTLVRTEQAGSLLDGDSWPWMIEYDPSSDDFAVGKPRWTPRYSGTQGNNPGPSPVADSSDPYNTSAPTGAKLSAGVYFRNRLWFASGDVLFSSQFNDPFNMFIQDPSDLVDTDPIDITASSGANSTVTWLIAYSDFLFVTTTGKTQYELKGSQNFIGPKTASLEPTSFYGTSRFTAPTKVGSILFFTDAGRLFMYHGSNTDNIQTAVNVSQNVFGYFPQDISNVTAAPNQDTMMFVDSANENHMYLYTARFNGEQQAQNAFYRWTLGNEAKAKHMYVIDNYLYILNRRPTQLDVDGETVLDSGTFLEKVYLERTLPTDVMLDRRISVDGVADGADTLFPIPYTPSPGETVVAWHNNAALDGVLENSGGSYWFRATNVSLAGQAAIVGEKFLMDIELSTPIMRDERNNYIDGRLVLKDMNIRHYNTGQYDVAIYRWGRDPSIVSFDPMRANNPMHAIGTNNYYEVEGSFSPKVQALDSKSDIHIQSSTPVPVNITNIEFRADFSAATSGSVTQ